MDEPEYFSAEADFQRKTLEAIRESIPTVEFIVSFGLDAAAFVPSTQPLRLLEFKIFTFQRPVGVPFGRDRTQVQLLSLPDSALASLDGIVRWCFADMRGKRGERRFAILTSSEAKAAAMGGVKSGKENNFNINRVMEQHAINWDTYLRMISEFVSGLPTVS